MFSMMDIMLYRDGKFGNKTTLHTWSDKGRQYASYAGKTYEVERIFKVPYIELERPIQIGV